MDAEEEGVFFTSCAGGVRTDLSLPLKYTGSTEDIAYTLTLCGLSGGHSGLDIALGKANAIQLVGRILYHIAPFARISSLDAPGKANAIASKGTIVMHTSSQDEEALLKELSKLEEMLKAQFSETENLSFRLEKEEQKKEVTVFTKETVNLIIEANYVSSVRRYQPNQRKCGNGTDIF